MLKNLVISILVILVVAEGVMLYSYKYMTKPVQITAAITPTPTLMPRPKPLMKGDKLTDSSVAKFSYKVAPGELDANAKNALVGWDITAKKMSDGSLQVNLTPKDSSDQSQQYTVKTGNMLYFVEMTPVDDHADKDTDSNLRDDYGIIVDNNGIVQ